MTSTQRFRKLIQFCLVLGDFLVVPLVYIFSYWIRSKSSLFFFQEKMPLDRYYWITHHLWFLVFLHVMIAYFLGLYDRQYTFSSNQIIIRTIRSVTLEILILVSVYFFRQDLQFPRSIFVLLWLFLTLGTISWHLLWAKLFDSKIPQRNLLIVGVNDNTATLLKELERLPTYRLKVIGLLTDSDSDSINKTFMQYPILGNREDLLELVRIHNVHEVVISSANTWQDNLINQISHIDQIPTRICIIPTCYEILIGKIKHLRLYDIPLIEVIKHPQPFIGKRFVDFIIAMTLFLITLPIFLITAIAIKIFCGSPILYKQIRLGKDKIPFTILKFRTLIENAEKETGPVLTTSNEDKRLTKIGRFLRKYRIDELPQLINIMKGEMSFIGPRPERPYFVTQYIDRISGYGERFKATPGLTGLAQVNGGYATTPENKLKYDLAYIYNQSFWLDIRIMLETVKVILTGKIE